MQNVECHHIRHALARRNTHRQCGSFIDGTLAAVKGDGDMVATAALRLKSKLDLVLRGMNPPGA